MQGKSTRQARILHLPRQHNNSRAGKLSATLNSATNDEDSSAMRAQLSRYLDHPIQDLPLESSAEGFASSPSVIKVYVKKSRKKIYKA